MTTEIQNVVYRAENPLKAIALDVLDEQRGVLRVPLLALRIRAEFVRRGGNCGSPEWQAFGLRGLSQWLASIIKRRGFYDVSAKGYRSFVGANRRQLLAGAQYKRQKGDENYVSANALDRLADWLPSDEAIVTPAIYKDFRKTLKSEAAA